MGLVDGSRLEGGGCLKQPLEKHRLGQRLGVGAACVKGCCV